MKIGLINFYFANNFGATLQCYALYSILKKNGHIVEVIDYRSQDILDAYHMKFNAIKDIIYELQKEKKDIKYPLKIINRTVRYYVWYVKNWRLLIKMKNYNDFIEKELLKTKECYKSLDELISNPPKCDCYIAGSDQIWNIENTGGKLDEAFFMKFGLSKTIRIVYGASCGRDNLSTRYVNNILDYCKDIDFISVREQSLLEQLCKCKDKLLISKVCDPVFLLTKEDWDKVKAKTKHVDKEYILIYLLNKPENLQKLIDELRAYYVNCKIYDISYRKSNVNGIDKYDQSCGPDVFLNYICNAKMIVTDSFHGTAFSIIYHKRFISLIRLDTGIRISDLLINMQLTDCIYDPKRSMASYDKEIDYYFAEKYVNHEKEDSLEFLKKSLQR